MKIGIDLGGSHIAIGVVDKEGRILEKIEKRLTKVEKQNIKKSIEKYIIEQVNIFQQKYKIEEIGIGTPGIVKDGVILTGGNLCIENYNIVERLQKNIKLPIKLRNDAKCAALAEKKYGCLKEHENRSLFLTLGTGIGGAILFNDNVLGVNNECSCELGHMVIHNHGIPCHCGREGCFERYASMKALKNNLRKSLSLDETTRGQELLEMIRENRPEKENYEVIENTLTEYIENLSLGIDNLIRILDPERIGIGGSFVYFEDVLLERLEKALTFKTKVIIQTAILGNEAGIIGAVL